MNYSNISLSNHQGLMTRERLASQNRQDQFGRQVAARLSGGADTLPHDISERLRVARDQALALRKSSSVRTASGLNGSAAAATMTMGEENVSLWDRLAAAIPLIALLAGLIMINVVQNENRAREVADVDSALLTDDLPPSAYTDPGFAQFLKTSAQQLQ